MMLYKDIGELPIFNWFEFHKSFNYELLINKRYILLKWLLIKNKKKLQSTWFKLYNQYLEEFGIPESMQTEIERLNKIAIMKADLIITGQKYLKTLIEIEEQLMKMENRTMEKASLDVNLARLSKFYGFKVNSMTTSTREYYSFIKTAKNG